MRPFHVCQCLQSGLVGCRDERSVRNGDVIKRKRGHSKTGDREGEAPAEPRTRTNGLVSRDLVVIGPSANRNDERFNQGKTDNRMFVIAWSRRELSLTDPPSSDVQKIALFKKCTTNDRQLASGYACRSTQSRKSQ